MDWSSSPTLFWALLIGLILLGWTAQRGKIGILLKRVVHWSLGWAWLGWTRLGWAVLDRSGLVWAGLGLSLGWVAGLGVGWAEWGRTGRVGQGRLGQGIAWHSVAWHGVA